MKPNERCSAMIKIIHFLDTVWLPSLFCFLLLSFVQTCRAGAQSTETQKEQQQITSVLSNPELMTRAYGFFFAYQHHLDAVADQQEASGKDVSELRRLVQNRLGFSDEEYKPVRESCDRVAAEVKILHDEIRSNPKALPTFARSRDVLQERILHRHGL